MSSMKQEQFQILFEILQKINRKTEQNSIVIGEWIPKYIVQKFFNYSSTQMLQLEKEHCLVISKVKSRKFYLLKSILELLETNILKTK